MERGAGSGPAVGIPKAAGEAVEQRKLRFLPSRSINFVGFPKMRCRAGSPPASGSKCGVGSLPPQPRLSTFPGQRLLPGSGESPSSLDENGTRVWGCGGGCYLALVRPLSGSVSQGEISRLRGLLPPTEGASRLRLRLCPHPQPQARPGRAQRTSAGVLAARSCCGRHCRASRHPRGLPAPGCGRLFPSRWAAFCSPGAASPPVCDVGDNGPGWSESPSSARPGWSDPGKHKYKPIAKLRTMSEM